MREVITKVPLARLQAWMSNTRRFLKLDDMEETEGYVPFSRNNFLRSLQVFDQLYLRANFRLDTFVWRSTTMGGGLVLARGRDWPDPEIFQLPDPVTPVTPSPWLPRQAHHAMVAFGGTGTPESFLQASLLSRELQELGAFYETLRWREHVPVDRAVLLPEPSEFDPVDARQVTRFPYPTDLSPRIRRHSRGFEVIFYTTHLNEPGKLFRFNDRYVPGKAYCYLSTQTLVMDVQKSRRALTPEQAPVRPPKSETQVYYA